MSFSFPSWETAFSEGFHDDAKAMLEGALNKGNKPPVIQGRIEVVELSMGTQPPTLTLLEIGDLSLDRFRGIFRLGYQGDAWLEVRCRVQANPLSHNPHLAPNSTLPLSTPLLASQPLLVPMTLRLSLIHLRAILILVVSATKGITLVFKNDPLQNVDVSSTFDSVEVIRGYLQQEIEGQLREMFREDLPGIIHRLSQRWFSSGGVGGKVETPYVDELRAGGGGSAQSTPSKRAGHDDDLDDEEAERNIFPPYHPPASPTATTTPKRRSSQRSVARPRRLSAASESPTSYTVFPDIEDYDPTYGLRPEGLPTHSGYEAFGRLWEKAREGEGRGLGGIMGVEVDDAIREESEESDWDGREADEVVEGDDGVGSVDMVELESSLEPMRIGGSRPALSRQQSRHTRQDEDLVEYETIPAVGGGTITRPRVYHSQSKIRAPSEIGMSGGNQALPSPSGSITARASSIGGGSTIGIGAAGRPALPKFMTTGPQTPRHGGAPHPHPLAIGGPANRRRGTSVSGLGMAGPGPSSLRRSALVQGRQDVFSPNRSAPASHLHPRRTQSSQGVPRTATTSSSAARTSMGSSHDEPSRSNTLSTPASSQLPPSRAMSVSGSKEPSRHSRHVSGSFSQTGTSYPPRNAGLAGITLPLNNSVSQLATLSHSNHTLSPYARSHEHIAVRSFPHLGRTATSGGIGTGNVLLSWGARGGPSQGQGDESVKMRAKRKRIFRMGSKENKMPNLQVEDDPVPDDVDDSFSPASLSPDEHPAQGAVDSQLPWQPVSRPSSVMGLGLRQRPPMFGRSDSMASYGFPVVGSRRGSIHGRLEPS